MSSQELPQIALVTGGSYGLGAEVSRLLGRSGLRVSPLALGTMTFGTDWGWGSDEADARRIFDAYADVKPSRIVVTKLDETDSKCFLRKMSSRTLVVTGTTLE